MFFENKKIVVNLPGSHLNVILKLCHSLRNQFLVSEKCKAEPSPVKSLYVTRENVKGKLLLIFF